MPSGPGDESPEDAMDAWTSSNHVESRAGQTCWCDMLGKDGRWVGGTRAV